MNQGLSKFAIFALGILAACLALGAAPGEGTNSSQVDSAYQQSFDKWKTELVDDLKQNWLPLAGLFWLKPGENSFGSATENAVVFPKGPAHAGVFVLHGDDVTVKFSADAHAAVDGKAITTAALQPDTSGKRTIVEMGSLRFHVIERGQRVGIRLKDLESDAVKEYPGPVFFPLNLNYRITAAWIPSDGKKLSTCRTCSAMSRLHRYPARWYSRSTAKNCV